MIIKRISSNFFLSKELIMLLIIVFDYEERFENVNFYDFDCYIMF